jgi:hypothetical protein
VLILARCCAVYIWWSNTRTSEEIDETLKIGHDHVGLKTPYIFIETQDVQVHKVEIILEQR